MKSKANAHMPSCRNLTAGRETQWMCPLGYTQYCICMCACVFMGICEAPAMAAEQFWIQSQMRLTSCVTIGKSLIIKGEQSCNDILR